jgi:hypothetical protein
MSNKYLRVNTSCQYAGLVDGSLYRRVLRQVNVDRTVCQIIFSKSGETYTPIQTLGSLAPTGLACLIGVENYSSSGGLHSHHAISALLINKRLYLFNAHGNLSQDMRFFAYYLMSLGLQIDSAIQYQGPNLQAQDEKGVCTAFAQRFLLMHPNSSMNQAQFDEYVFKGLSGYSISNLYKYLETITSVRNIGQSSRNRSNELNRNRNVNRMNININRKPFRHFKRPT